MSLLVALPVLACLGACASTRSVQKRLNEESLPPQPMLAAATKFADGAILVQGRLISMEYPQPQKEEDRQHSDKEEGVWRGMIDDMPGGPTSGENIEVLRARRAMLPRMALTITFTNIAPESVEFAVVEVRSLLGNFVPRPEQFTLAPGRDGALDPMLSNLPTNLDELEVTLTLRHGDRSETRVLKLPPAPSSAALPAPRMPRPALGSLAKGDPDRLLARSGLFFCCLWPPPSPRFFCS